MFLAHPAPFSGTGFGLSKVQAMTLITLAWLGWATLKQGAGLTGSRFPQT
jgi:hypothetical protein